MTDKKAPLAVLLVGHAHWGKSRTLRALTDGSLQRSGTFGDRDFFIRRMSNDDHTDDFNNLVGSLSADDTPALILAFCPDFQDADKESEWCLQTLAKNYRLSFFVLRHAFGDDRTITEAEIATMSRYGSVEIFEPKGADAETRAQVFRAHIVSVA